MIAKRSFFLAVAFHGLSTVLTITTARALNPQPLPPGIRQGIRQYVGGINQSQNNPPTRPAVSRPHKDLKTKNYFPPDPIFQQH